MNTSLKRFIDLVVVFTDKEMKVKYKSSILGYVWSIAHPLALALVFFIAFKMIMRVQIEQYALFLICGLFPWQWFSNSVNMSPTVFLSNATIIKKVNFQRNVIPFVTVLQDMIHFLLSIIVILIFMYIYGRSPSLSWIYGIPLLVIIQFMITYGITLMISTINLFFRDMERLTVIFVTLMFYCTPIIYSESMIPEKYRIYVNLNPLAPLMISWRQLFLEGTFNWVSILVSLGYSVGFLLLGTFIYKKLSWKFGEIL